MIFRGILTLIQANIGLCTFIPTFDFSMDVLKINSTDVKPSIINSSHHADDMMECTYRCDEIFHLSIYYMRNEKICHCNIDIDRSVVGVSNSDIFYGFFNYYIQIPGSSSVQTVPMKFDCLDLYLSGIQDDGVYIINPKGTEAVEAWCDMKDGGWTVFQKRMNGKVVFFNKNWTEYQDGFGDKNEEYWLGFNHIHVLTQDHASLKIELGRFGNPSPPNCSAEYSTFVITDELDNYRIIVDGHSGTCPDVLVSGSPVTTANNSAFSTWDKDNDNDTGNCAEAWDGAWWFTACFHTNLMGHYYQANNTNSGYGTLAAAFTGYYESLETTLMKVRRN